MSINFINLNIIYKNIFNCFASSYLLTLDYSKINIEQLKLLYNAQQKQ